MVAWVRKSIITGRTYVYEAASMLKAREVVNEFLETWGSSLDSKVEYSVKDVGDDVERITLGVIIKIRPPYLKTKKGLEKAMPSLKGENINCLWSE